MNKCRITTVVATLLLAACGGGGDDTSTSVNSVKVVGASLADSGTYGYKFTLQPAGTTTYPVYSERVAADYGMTDFCPAYTSDGSTYAANSGCTNYAVAGAKVNNYSFTYAQVLENYPGSAIKQLEDVGAAGFTSRDLLIVGEASSNDAAALATAFLDDQLSSGATTEFPTLLATLLSDAELAANASSAVALGSLYMQKLADMLMDAVVTNALNKGAKRIAIVNTLDITMTPRFQAVLDQVSAANGGGTTGDTAAAQVQALVEAWIDAYNRRLEADVAYYSGNVVLVDLYTNFNLLLARPANYGLTNTTDTVCDEIVTGGTAPGVTSLPVAAAACTDSAATALTPPPDGSDGTADWWKTYLFSDNFHPTPYGHQLLEDIVTERLTAVGWM
ncbi:MAG: phospholipase [Gammaproteobacteria bacterium]|nr:phospholipase [Gammaproteobacteria bacterium]MBU1414370.1 phospholipase [Gammaproteobacteria bacterium]